MELLGVSDFPFWGNREYVQSSHLLETFLKLWAASERQPLERVAVDFKELIRSNTDFVFLNNPQQTISSVRFRCYTKAGALMVGAIPNGKPVRHRLRDDEAELVAQAEVRPGRQLGTIQRPNSTRLIGTMVALLKKVHLVSLPSEGYGQWFVAGVDLDVLVMKKAAGLSMAAIIDREVGGRMTRSSVMLGDSKLATVSFYREPARD